jgi:hypothetical protein
MKFLLDIDGVMVHANPGKCVELESDGFYKFNAIAVQVLKSVVYTTKDEFVLSTSHRFRFTIMQWKKIFRDRGIPIKKISILNIPLDNTSNRMLEIVSWFNINHIDTDEIVIIDDDKSLNELPPSLKDRLVLTNSYVGLEDNSDLIRIIKRPVRKLAFNR